MRRDVAFWGAMVCSQVWSAAPGAETTDTVLAAMWVVFAIGIWVFDLRRTDIP